MVLYTISYSRETPSVPMFRNQLCTRTPRLRNDPRSFAKKLQKLFGLKWFAIGCAQNTLRKNRTLAPKLQTLQFTAVTLPQTKTRSRIRRSPWFKHLRAELVFWSILRAKFLGRSSVFARNGLNVRHCAGNPKKFEGFEPKHHQLEEAVAVAPAKFEMWAGGS